jgi:AcrR family transcriptional regulator
MAVPAQRRASGRSEWSTLDADGKRSRLLEAAEAVFAQDGLEAPVPAIAAAAGAGVGSVYRAFASKDEIVAALAVHRLRWVQDRAGEALEDPDSWSGLEGLLRTVAERQQADGVLAEALAAAFERPEVAEPLATATATAEAVLHRARRDGTVRADITTGDLRAVFAGLRAAEAAEPDGAARLLELVLDGLRRAGP